MIGALSNIFHVAVSGGAGASALPTDVGGAVCRDGDQTSHSGVIAASADHTYVNGKLVARKGDACGAGDTEDGHGGSTIEEGSDKLMVQGVPVARVGDPATCGASMATGSSTTFEQRGS